MIKVDDEILNKYLDGELNRAETADVKKQIEESELLQMKFKALSAVHNALLKREAPQVSIDFTRNVMKKLGSRAKAKREQKYFIFSVSTIFIIASLVIVGFVLSSLFSSPIDSNTAERMTDTLSGMSSFIANFFTSKNISIFGSIISGGIIISAYFFFDSQKNARRNFGK